jgi:hypothetical protein
MDAVVDWNNACNTITAAVNAGYNVINMAFYLTDKPFDVLLAWRDTMTSAAQQACANYAHSKGSVIFISAGGSTETPFLTVDATTYGNTLAQWAIDHWVDGVDFDMYVTSPYSPNALSSFSSIPYVNGVYVVNGLVPVSRVVQYQIH